MFAGTLLPTTIFPFKTTNTLLAVFSNQLYIFDADESTILKKIQLSETLIKTWIFCQEANKFIALD